MIRRRCRLRIGKGTKVFCALLLTGACVFTFSGKADAGKRLHDQITGGNAVQAHSVTDEGNGGIKARIDALLHPKAEQAKQRHEKVDYKLLPVDLDNGDILGGPMATEAQCVNYLLKINPSPNISVTPEELVSYYYEEATKEGVRPDVAFAQALHETGNFSYGGTVTPDQNNYCGLGTTSEYVQGGYFPSAQIGVRAHIQHLLAYATTRIPSSDIVDPRYTMVRDIYGAMTLPHWLDLNGRWAVPGTYYGQHIMAIFQQILQEPVKE
ncbi:MAG: glucosaminidase domain-containing protein [Schwartzia sp.]|nr:glucosaminidase domain-containing protein [Schwartzia sp. (in: firmicutes)]